MTIKLISYVVIDSELTKDKEDMNVTSNATSSSVLIEGNIFGYP